MKVIGIVTGTAEPVAIPTVEADMTTSAVNMYALHVRINIHDAV